MEREYYWQDYCDNNWIAFTKIKNSPASESYYFIKNNNTIVLTTKYPLCAKVVDSEQVVLNLSKIFK